MRTLRQMVEQENIASEGPITIGTIVIVIIIMIFAIPSMLRGKE